MDLSIYQLMTLRSLRGAGWPPDLLEHLWLRCDLKKEDWDRMAEDGLVRLMKDNRWHLTGDGKREYERQKKTKYF